jgi:hypothetical protein
MFVAGLLIITNHRFAANRTHLSVMLSG